VVAQIPVQDLRGHREVHALPGGIMSNVVLIRRKHRKKSVLSFFRRKVITSVRTQPWCAGCDGEVHHPGKPRRGCHCWCSTRTR
jgi:hypothetical protein